MKQCEVMRRQAVAGGRKWYIGTGVHVHISVYTHVQLGMIVIFCVPVCMGIHACVAFGTCSHLLVPWRWIGPVGSRLTNEVLRFTSVRASLSSSICGVRWCAQSRCQRVADKTVAERH